MLVKYHLPTIDAEGEGLLFLQPAKIAMADIKTKTILFIINV